MSENSNIEPRQAPRPSNLEVKAIDYLSAEIKSKNYNTLMEAMGQSKYKEYKWGGGLNNAANDIRENLVKISPGRSLYSYGEYLDGGEYKKHLFIEKTLDDGATLVYVVDVDRSQRNIYKLDNLYVVGGEGKTVDLLEELDVDQQAFMVPVGHVSFDLNSGTILLGDLDLISEKLGKSAGVPAYVHEIGHSKDLKLNPDLYKTKLAFQKMLAGAVNMVELYQPDIRSSDNRFVKKVITQLGEAGKYILQSENNATDYVRVFMTRKRDQGVDLSPLNPGGLFAEQLHSALVGYELEFFGKQFTESPMRTYYGSEDKNLQASIQAYVDIIRFIKKQGRLKKDSG